mmetsp:Transcript_18614/g.57234  ORF Transcript_18614/g.57234 Transcript_18614/m.57234 type:complete len:236 (-) Transcript_18614:349-1056(-)
MQTTTSRPKRAERRPKLERARREAANLRLKECGVLQCRARAFRRREYVGVVAETHVCVLDRGGVLRCCRHDEVTVFLEACVSNPKRRAVLRDGRQEHFAVRRRAFEHGQHVPVLRDSREFELALVLGGFGPCGVKERLSIFPDGRERDFEVASDLGPSVLEGRAVLRDGRQDHVAITPELLVGVLQCDPGSADGREDDVAIPREALVGGLDGISILRDGGQDDAAVETQCLAREG